MRSDQLEPFDHAAHEARSVEGFKKELTELINRYSRENGSDTPDFLLADYLMDSLETWNRATSKREQWYGRGHIPAEPA